MILAIDARSLVEENPTGVTVYTRSFLNTLPVAAQGRFSKCLLVTTGSRTLASGVFPDHPWYERVHIPVSSKVSAAALMVGYTYRSRFMADALWMPNINIPLPVAAPYVLTVHDLSFIDRPQWYSMRGRIWHWAMRYRELVGRSAGVAPVSDFTRHRFEALFPDYQGAITVVPPLVARRGTNDGDGKSVLDRLRIDRPYILFLGTIEERKNLKGFVQAMSLLGSYDILGVIVGKQGYLRRATRSMIETDKIRVIPYVTNEDRDQLMSRATAFVWPSFYEGFGYPPLEALQAAVPVIVSYRTALPEVLRQNAIYVNPYNAREIARAVGHILQRRPSDAMSYSAADRSTELLIQQLRSVCV